MYLFFAWNQKDCLKTLFFPLQAIGCRAKGGGGGIGELRGGKEGGEGKEREGRTVNHHIRKVNAPHTVLEFQLEYKINYESVVWRWRYCNEHNKKNRFGDNFLFIQNTRVFSYQTNHHQIFAIHTTLIRNKQTWRNWSSKFHCLLAPSPWDSADGMNASPPGLDGLSAVIKASSCLSLEASEAASMSMSNEYRGVSPPSSLRGERGDDFISIAVAPPWLTCGILIFCTCKITKQ